LYKYTTRDEFAATMPLVPNGGLRVMLPLFDPESSEVDYELMKNSNDFMPQKSIPSAGKVLNIEVVSLNVYFGLVLIE
jgi:hypothetical protein